MLRGVELFAFGISAVRDSLVMGKLICVCGCWNLLSVCFICGVMLSLLTAEAVADNSGKLLPGIQVVQSVELPASTSNWGYNDGAAKLGKPRPLDTSKTEIMRYWLYLPHDYEQQAQAGGSPLFLFLHGAGERGNAPEEIVKVKVHGLPKLLDKPEFNKTFPCIAISPQCKHNFEWSPSQLLLLLDHIERNYKIDKRRVYITGISMGGFGTWMCLNSSPERFAAAAPVCGGAETEWAKRLVTIPIWSFHGDSDNTVPFSMSQKIVAAIREAGGKKVIFTSYKGGGHDVWTQTYNNQLLFDWFFSHSR
jgi:predicted peptidase